jgi:hypothetical protein
MLARIAPVSATPRVAEYCGLQATSIPPPFPVTVPPLKVTIERSWIRTPGPALPLMVAANRAAEASRIKTPALPFPEIEPVKSSVELNCASTPTLELFEMATEMAAIVSRAILRP